MPDESRYFPLTLESLRILGAWAADCAEPALPIFEARAPSDSRPKEALAAIRVFARGGRRTAGLRSASLGALAAAREAVDSAARSAAMAACLAASSAYTHPLKDPRQTKHILGPAAYTALALELAYPEDSERGRDALGFALESVPREVCAMLAQMPARKPGKSRVDELMRILDDGIRGLTI